MSRQNDTYLTLEQRTSKANQLKADCLVALHCNSSTVNAKGIETYCYKFKYRKLADCVHSELINSKAYTLDRGVKEGNLHMVRESSMSACLVELAFINNDDDIKILEQKQDELATGIAKGICKYLGITYNGGSDTPTYVVATGAYTNIENARKDVDLLRSKGFKDVYIHVHK